MEEKPDVKVIIGQRIKEARKNKKMTQTELASIIGRTESSIRKYEKGLTDIPSAVIQEIASALDVSSADLLKVEMWDVWDATYNIDELSKETVALDFISEKYGRKTTDLLNLFIQLNEEGQKKALEQLSDLTEVPKYQK